MSGKAISKANAARLAAIRAALAGCGKPLEELEAQLQAIPAEEPTDEPAPVKPEDEAKAAPTEILRSFAHIRKEAPAGFVRMDPNSHIYLASEAVTDRYDDIVRQNWNLTNYISGDAPNPVVLWGHQWDVPAIGKALQAVVLAGQLYIEVVYDLEDPLGAAIDRKFRNGFLNCVSVGFRSGIMAPRCRLEQSDPEYAPSGYILDNNELLELSAVDVPALPTATAQRTATIPLIDQVRGAIARDAGFRNELEAVLASAVAPVVPPANPGPPDATPEAITLEEWWRKI